MVSATQSSVSEHRLHRNANNSPIATNRAAAARFSARADAQIRSTNAADSGVVEGQRRSNSSSNRAICSAIGIVEAVSNMCSIMPAGYDRVDS